MLTHQHTATRCLLLRTHIFPTCHPWQSMATVGEKEQTRCPRGFGPSWRMQIARAQMARAWSEPRSKVPKS